MPVVSCATETTAGAPTFVDRRSNVRPSMTPLTEFESREIGIPSIVARASSAATVWVMFVSGVLAAALKANADNPGVVPSVALTSMLLAAPRSFDTSTSR